MSKIKTAIIPIAGYGSRMFPSTFFLNKAFLPIGKKPVILHIIEEAIVADIKNFIIIISENQKNIIDFLKPVDYSTDNIEVKNYNNLINSISLKYVIQKEQNGLADALLTIKNQINDDYFAVLLGDCCLLPSNTNYGISELIYHFNKQNETYIGLTRMSTDKLRNYGVIEKKSLNNRLVLIKNITEKPIDNPPSNLICAGRYIFSFSFLKLLESSIIKDKELLLPNIINKLIESQNVYGIIHSTNWLDVGNELEFIRSNIAYGLSFYKNEIKIHP